VAYSLSIRVRRSRVLNPNTLTHFLARGQTQGFATSPVLDAILPLG